MIMNQKIIDSLIRANKLEEGEIEIDDLVKVEPDNLEAIELLALIKIKLNKKSEALALFKKLSKFVPNQPAVWLNLGNVYYEMKELDNALINYEKALQIDDCNSGIYSNIANIYASKNEPYKSIDFLNKAIELNPHNSIALMNLGNRYLEIKNYKKSNEKYLESLAIEENNPECHFNFGNLMMAMGQKDKAIELYAKTIDLMPLSSTVIDKYDTSFKNLRLNKIYLATLTKKADAHMLRGEYGEAKILYEKVLDIDENFTFVLGQYILCKQKICDWTEFEENQIKLTNKINLGLQVTEPFATLGFLTSLNIQPGAAKLWGDKLFPQSDKLGLINRKNEKKEKIKIGYFSADFYNHATTHLMEGVWRNHDKNKFEIIAFSFDTRKKDELFKKIYPYFDKFIECDNVSDVEVSKIARRLEIDIAIDLKGYTSGCRPKIFAYRAAPIQINYLGYPGTMGASYMDYIIADKVLIPDDKKNYYTEKIIYLPDCYQPNNDLRKISPSEFNRADFGLPEDKFVFCCFNDSYKITPNVFRLWMQILIHTEDSILWLLKTNELLVDNIRKQAINCGVNPERIFFCSKIPVESHLARQRLADLFLDTWPYNAHTTASDALWVGLPVLTCIGETFASRVAASLLKSVHLEELITNSSDEYSDMAISLFHDRDKFNFLKRKLKNNIRSCDLFNTTKYTKNLELAYIEVYASII